MTEQPDPIIEAAAITLQYHLCCGFAGVNLEAHLAGEVVDAVTPLIKAEALKETADAWNVEGRTIRFNQARQDLTLQQRVRKWLLDRADRIARGDAQ